MQLIVEPYAINCWTDRQLPKMTASPFCLVIVLNILMALANVDNFRAPSKQYRFALLCSHFAWLPSVVFVLFFIVIVACGILYQFVQCLCVEHIDIYCHLSTFIGYFEAQAYLINVISVHSHESDQIANIHPIWPRQKKTQFHLAMTAVMASVHAWATILIGQNEI